MAPDRPLVSVVVPAYNAERWLAKAVASALGQTYPAVEVVIVDDGSSDGTLAVARRLAGDRVRVVAQDNAGACVARNRGLAEARGELVKFLDADDALAPDAVETQVAAIGSAGADGRDVPFGDVVRADEHLNPLPTAPRRYPDAFASADLADRIAALLSANIQTSLPLHRRERLDEVGGFRAHLRRGQEYDLHLRLALAGVRFRHVTHVCSYTRQHDAPDRIGNTSALLSDPASYLAVQVDRRRMLEEHLGTPLPRPVAAAMARGAWRHTRQLAQAGQIAAAQGYAEEALRLDPTVRQAGRAFGVLSRGIGPVRAEQVLVQARRAIQRARKLAYLDRT